MITDRKIIDSPGQIFHPLLDMMANDKGEHPAVVVLWPPLNDIPQEQGNSVHHKRRRSAYLANVRNLIDALSAMSQPEEWTEGMWDSWGRMVDGVYLFAVSEMAGMTEGQGRVDGLDVGLMTSMQGCVIAKYYMTEL